MPGNRFKNQLTHVALQITLYVCNYVRTYRTYEFFEKNPEIPFTSRTGTGYVQYLY